MTACAVKSAVAYPSCRIPPRLPRPYTPASLEATRLDGPTPMAREAERGYGCRAKNSPQALMMKVITSSAVWNVHVRAMDAPRSGQ